MIAAEETSAERKGQVKGCRMWGRGHRGRHKELLLLRSVGVHMRCDRTLRTKIL